MSRREMIGLAAALPLVLAGCAAADSRDSNSTSEEMIPNGVGSFDLSHDGSIQRSIFYSAGNPDGSNVLAVVLLHGYGQSAAQWIRVGLVDVMDHLDLHGQALVAVASDLGLSDLPADFVTEALVPEIHERFIPDRLAVSGISRGGATALDVSLGNPDMFASVGLHSPATTPMGEVDPMPWRCWLDIGDADLLLDGALATAATLRDSGVDVEEHVWEGRHVESYWKRHLAQYFDFHLSL